MKLFELFATLSLDTREFERNMRNATKQGSGFAGTMERQLTAGTVALGNLAADAAKSVARAVTGIVRDAFSFTGQLEQNIGGAEAVFKDFSANIQANAQTAYKTAGLSVSDYLAEANKMGSLLQGMGFTVGESFDTSVQWMQRAADVASIMGIDVSSAMQSIEGAAKGNFTMMDNLGVAMNDTALKAYALENGLIKTDKEWAKIGQQQKIAAAFSMFMDKTSEYAGNYAKENDTLAGSMTTLSAAWENLLSGAGDTEAFSDVLASAVDVIIKNAAEIFPRLVESAVEVFQSLSTKIEEYGPQWAALMLDAGSQIIASLYNGITGGDVTADQVKQSINQLVSGSIDLGALNKSVKFAVNWLVEQAAKILPKLTDAAVEVFKALGEAIEEYGPKWAALLLDAGSQMIASIYNGITGGDITPEQVKQTINDVITAISDAWNAVVTTVTSAYTAVTTFFNETIPQAWYDMVNSIETWWNEHVVTPIQNAISAVETFLGLKADKTVTLTVSTVYTNEDGSYAGGGVDKLDPLYAMPGLLYGAPGFATGLDYVPYNDFSARLHEGEAVLTKAEATLWRRGEGAGGYVGIDYGQLGQAMAGALAGMSVQMDSQAVGVLVTGAVSREMGRRVKGRQYTG